MEKKKYVSPSCYVVNVPYVTLLLGASSTMEERRVRYDLDYETEDAL